jgi:hypothetical protein
MNQNLPRKCTAEFTGMLALIFIGVGWLLIKDPKL